MRTTVRNSYTPKIGDYCNTIVVDQDKGVQYIFDSDGVWSQYTSKQQEGAPMFYVNSAVNAAKNELKTYADDGDATTLQAAKDYADTHGGSVTKQYVDDQDALTLQAAKDYTDTHAGQGDVTQQYVDEHDASTLSSAKSYADGKDSNTLQAAKNYADGAAAGAQSAAELYADNKDTALLDTVDTRISAAITAADVPTFTLSSVDLGEGQPLAANHFYAVYEEGSE